MMANSIVLAVPRGRILREVMPLVRRAGIEPEAAFDDPECRQLRFSTNHPDVEIIRVRAFDVATFVAFGAAQIGVAGNDVLMEFGYPGIYTPLDLSIGHCRLVVAQSMPTPKSKDDGGYRGHVRVATKYPCVTKKHFAARGIQAECIKFSGAVELAPTLGLCRRIVDLVSTGKTLAANGLVEAEHIASVTSRLIVNRVAMKTFPDKLGRWVKSFQGVVDVP